MKDCLPSRKPFLEHLPILRKRSVTYGTFYCKEEFNRSQAFFSQEMALHGGKQSFIERVGQYSQT